MDEDNEEFKVREQQMSNELDRQTQILVSRMDDEFLETLILAVRVVGYSLDNVVLEDFVEWCYSELEKEPPKDIKPIYNPW